MSCILIFALLALPISRRSISPWHCNSNTISAKSFNNFLAMTYSNKSWCFTSLIYGVQRWNVELCRSWAFKHDRFGVEERVKNGGVVKTADVARLMERFQSSLLKYWESEPETDQSKQSNDKGQQGQQQKKSQSLDKQGAIEERTIDTARRAQDTEQENQQQKQAEFSEEHEVASSKPVKMVPVLLLDEAHKLPALLQSDETIKSLLDSMLVLTKRASLTILF